jgi:hypothetical protein
MNEKAGMWSEYQGSMHVESMALDCSRCISEPFLLILRDGDATRLRILHYSHKKDLREEEEEEEEETALAIFPSSLAFPFT